MKKGQIYEGVIERVEFPNKGIIHLQDPAKEAASGGGTGTVIVKDGLPGQKVRFVVNKVRKDRSEGRILEVLEKAPAEIPSPCPSFGACGGCTYQNLPYEAQIALKEEQQKRLMDQAVRGTYAWEGVKKSPRQEAYRNKMEYTFGDEYKDGPLALGMHKKGSFYDIVNVPDCRIVDEDFRKIRVCTLEAAAESGLPYYHRMRHTGYLRHLLVRKAAKTGEILVDLVTTTTVVSAPLSDSGAASGSREAPAERTEDFLKDWVRRLLELDLDGRIVGILHTVNDSVADTVKDEGTEILYGQDFFYEELLGLTFKITPFSFFQTNSAGAEVLYDTVRDFAGETGGRVIFDLYCGTGTIAQILAPVAEKVVGVELVEEAVLAARENARLNGLTNCSFYAGDVLQVIDELQEVPDLIVLDPPRDGVNPKALRKILDLGVSKIIYVSCKMTSLARDLGPLQDAGYQVRRVRGVDMFPGTYHVETVALLEKNKTA